VVRVQVKRHLVPVRRRLSTLVAADRLPFRNINRRRRGRPPLTSTASRPSRPRSCPRSSSAGRRWPADGGLRRLRASRQRRAPARASRAAVGIFGHSRLSRGRWGRVRTLSALRSTGWGRAVAGSNPVSPILTQYVPTLVRGRGEAVDRAGEAQPRTLPRRLHVSASRRRGCRFEVADCDLKQWSRRPSLCSLRLSEQGVAMLSSYAESPTPTRRSRRGSSRSNEGWAPTMSSRSRSSVPFVS
jgi:hypothetical protein